MKQIMHKFTSLPFQIKFRTGETQHFSRCTCCRWRRRRHFQHNFNDANHFVLLYTHSNSNDVNDCTNGRLARWCVRVIHESLENSFDDNKKKSKPGSEMAAAAIAAQPTNTKHIHATTTHAHTHTNYNSIYLLFLQFKSCLCVYATRTLRHSIYSRKKHEKWKRTKKRFQHKIWALYTYLHRTFE